MPVFPEPTPPEPFRARYGATYDGEIATADSLVAHFIATLKSEGVYDKALIILLSDHGEGLNDHGEQEHGVLLYREDIHVPLIVKLPGQRSAGTAVDGCGRTATSSSPCSWVDSGTGRRGASCCGARTMARCS